MNQYTTTRDITMYIKDRPSFTGTPEQLTAMVNYFAEGAITGLSNFLYEQLAENGNELQHGLQKGCRCGSCYEWQIVEDHEGDDPGVVIARAESISDWAMKG